LSQESFIIKEYQIEECQIEECQPGDVEKVRALFASCYGRSSDRYPSSAEWDWRYRSGVYDSTIWLAKWRQRLVAQRPTVIKTVKIGQEYHAAAHFMDVMTHPEFRYRGLFTRLLRWATAAVTEQGAVICYSFPNENSYPGYVKKTDWAPVDGLSLFIKPVRAEPILRERVRSQPLRNVLALLLQPGLALVTREGRRAGVAGVSVRRLASFDQRFDAFWDQVAEEYEVIIRRDSQHLNWRYVHRPSIEYAIYVAEKGEGIQGFIVVRTRQMFGMNLGMIIELLVSNGNQAVARALVARGVQHLLDVGAEAVACVLPDHLSYRQALRQEGFVRVPEALMPRRFYFMVRVNQDDQTLKKALDRRNWYLAWGDNDAV